MVNVTSIDDVVTDLEKLLSQFNVLTFIFYFYFRLRGGQQTYITALRAFGPVHCAYSNLIK